MRENRTINVLENEPGFDALLGSVMTERRVDVPAGLEQRLNARLAQEAAVGVVWTPVVRPFAFADAISGGRSQKSMWYAIGAHAVVLLVAVAALAAGRTRLAPKLLTADNVTPMVAPPPPALRVSANGGGGGTPDHAPAAAGHLPKVAETQIVPPAQPPKITPQLVVEPTVVMPNVTMATSTLPNLGLPNSSMAGNSLGNGHGGGIGDGSGAGVGVGTGSGVGGGFYHVGGRIKMPVVLHSVEPEFSEEARKAKFSGNVQVYFIIDEQGVPTHIRIARGVGMGLDDKALEAVRQYRFKPAVLDGKPVKVDMYMNVEFTIN